jgi:hypothetical protein
MRYSEKRHKVCMFVLVTKNHTQRSYRINNTLHFKNNTPPMPLNDAHLGGFFVTKLELELFNKS